jgi:hypothetical protein
MVLLPWAMHWVAERTACLGGHQQQQQQQAWGLLLLLLSWVMMAP